MCSTLVPPMRTISLTAIEGIPMVKAGDDLAALIASGLDHTGFKLAAGDILVVCQKVVSKAEGRVVNFKDFEPSEFAKAYARRWEKDPRAIEIVLRQTSRIVRNDRGVLIVETGPGWVCANAGRLRDEIRRRLGVTVAVLITDTFGRPWRDGLTEICLGIAGMNPVLDLRGTTDLGGRELHHTVIAIADEIAAAPGLLVAKAGAIPAVVVRGYPYEPFEGSAKILIRPPEADLFR